MEGRREMLPRHKPRRPIPGMTKGGAGPRPAILKNLGQSPHFATGARRSYGTSRWAKYVDCPGFGAGPAILWLLACAAIHAQSPPTLTLQQAEAMALQNHPQIQAA